MTVTRYYFTRTLAHPTPPPFDPAWVTTGGAVRHVFATFAPVAGDPLGNVNAQETVAGVTTVLAGQWLTPMLPAGNVVGTFRTVLTVRESSGGVDGYVRVIVRLVGSDGTVRATLADVTHGTETGSEASYPTRTLSAVLTPATAQAGDRLAVEVGHHHLSTDTIGRSLNLKVGTLATAGTPLEDAPYLENVASEGAGAPTPLRQWLEFDLATPPDAPSSVTVTDATEETVTLAWTAPAAGAAATGYTVSIDGAPPIDRGLSFSWVVPGLTAGTSYTFTVAGYNAAGAGPGVSVEGATDDPPPPPPPGTYRVRVDIGAHTWSASSADPPELGVALPLAFGWSMAEDGAGYPAQLEVGTAPMVLVVPDGAELAGIDVGTPLRVRVWLDPDPDAEPYATYVGVVGDFEVSPHPRGVAARLLGVDWTTELAGRTVGSSGWPEESGDARAARIMAENGDEPWTSETIGNTFEPRTGQAASAYDALRETLTAAARFANDRWSAPGRVLLTVDTTDTGTLDTFRGRFAAAESTAIDKLPTAVWRATSWMRNRVTDGRWVHIDHPGGPSTYGDVRGTPRPRIAVPVYDVDALAQLALGTVPGFSWVSAAPLRLDLSHPDAVPPPGWFSGPLPGVGRVVVVDVEAMPGVFTRYAGMLAAAQLTLEPGGRVYIDFRLRPDVPAHSSVTPRWEDEPIDQTWADEPPDATWYELRTIHREDYPT